MNPNDTKQLINLQDTAGGLPSLSAGQIIAVIHNYIEQQGKDGKAVDHYKSRLRWFLRWLPASGMSSEGLLYQEDFIAFELWLRSAKSTRQQLLVSQQLRQEILKRLRGALRWANLAGHLDHDYSVWVPAAHMDAADQPTEGKVEPAAPFEPVVMDNNITTANLRAWLPMFCVSGQGAGSKPSTLEWYQRMIESYLQWVEQHEGLNPTNPVALEYFLLHLQKVNSKFTVQTKYRALRAFFNWLIKRRFIRFEDAPTKVIPSPRVPKKRMRYVTTEEFDCLYASIKGTGWTDWRDRALFTILFYSGLRASEVLNLRPTDIDHSNKVIHVQDGKGGKDRDVPYAPQLEMLIDRYLAQRPPCPENMHLFLSNDGKNGVRGQVQYDGFKMIVRRRLKASELPKINLHAFRHGFAMWALNNGMAMSAVSKAMGHASVTTTESIYAHWTLNGLKAEYNGAFQRVMGSEAIKT